MSPLGEGWPAIAAIVLAAALPTEVWRWIGVAVGRRIDPNSELLSWVRAVATGIIAAFVAKVIFLPTGTLADIPLWLRLLAVAAGAAAYAWSRRLVIAGCATGMAVMVVGRAFL